MIKKSVLVVASQLNEANQLGAWTSEAHPFHVNIVTDDESAIELLHKERYDMVVVDHTDSKINDKKLQAVLPILQEDVTVLGYKGESVKELEDSITAVFEAKKFQRIKRMLLLEPAMHDAYSLPGFSLN